MTSSPHVAIIGAGTLGMATASNLCAQGARVTVLEANGLASGSSGRSVGVVGTQFTDPFDIMLRTHAKYSPIAQDLVDVFETRLAERTFTDEMEHQHG